MSTHAHRTSDPLAALRWLDLVVAAVALPVFVVADFPLAGYAAGAGAWVAQRAIQVLIQRRAEAATNPRTVVGLTAGSMLARAWMVALTILLVGLSDNQAGLAASLLVVALFTVYFNVGLVTRGGAAR